MVALLPASTPLPRPPNGFSLVSLNVLLPNSIDGWWLYKYYPPGVPDAAMAWPARAALLESLLLRADPDIVCLQECAASNDSAAHSWRQTMSGSARSNNDSSSAARAGHAIAASGTPGG